MSRCKYPESVCPHMTVLNGHSYCDTVPCQLTGELPKLTNADRIRSMTDEELAEYFSEEFAGGFGKKEYLDWLKSSAEREE